MDLEILYEDHNLIAINKPNGLLVHKTRLAKDATEFALQILRDQIGQRVYPCHRLDRKTSGVLLFAKNNTCNALLQQQFRERKVSKKYLALVRGFTPPEERIEYALTNENTTQLAVTEYKTLKLFEVPLPSQNFKTSRYSLIELIPLTGRFHQLRKHMAHVFHPIIGDRPHGCNKQNRLWKMKVGIDQMLLHAQHLSLNYENIEVNIEAPLSPPFLAALNYLKSNNSTDLGK